MALGGSGQYYGITRRRLKTPTPIPNANLLAQLYAEKARKEERGEDIALQEKGIVSGETTAQNQLVQQLALAEQERQLTERLSGEQMTQQRETAEEALAYQKQQDESARGIQVADLAIKAATSAPAWELAKWGFDKIFPNWGSPATPPITQPVQPGVELASTFDTTVPGWSGQGIYGPSAPAPVTGAPGAVSNTGLTAAGEGMGNIGGPGVAMGGGVAGGAGGAISNFGLTAAGEGFGTSIGAAGSGAVGAGGLAAGLGAFAAPVSLVLAQLPGYFASKRQMKDYYGQPSVVSTNQLRRDISDAVVSGQLTDPSQLQGFLDAYYAEHTGRAKAMMDAWPDDTLGATGNLSRIPANMFMDDYTAGINRKSLLENRNAGLVSQPQPVIPKIPALTGGLAKPIPGFGGYKSAL